MSEIKACPFVCGGGVERNSDKWGHYYVCDCGARGPYGDSPATALERWNTRPPSQPGRVEMARAILKSREFSDARIEYFKTHDLGVWVEACKAADAIRDLYALTNGTEPGAVTDGRQCPVQGCAEIVGDRKDPRWDQGQCPQCNKWFWMSEPLSRNSTDE